MATQTARIQWRRDVASDLAADNPTLASGEAAMETDTGRWKLGPGAWNSLPYQPGTTAAQMAFAATGTIAATNVQDAIVEVAAEAGGGGAVASVNGQTGVVSLDAADVGADTAGSSAAVQANLDGHEALQGLGSHLPSGGTTGQVTTRTVDGVAWQDPTSGGAVDSVNGQTGVVALDAADVGADPSGTAAGAVAGHADDYGSGAHLPTGGTEGQYLVKGAGVETAWQSAAVDLNAFAAACVVTVSYDEGTSAYVPPASLSGLGLSLASFHRRIWVGPTLPKDTTGGATWAEHDFYLNTSAT